MAAAEKITALRLRLATERDTMKPKEREQLLEVLVRLLLDAERNCRTHTDRATCDQDPACAWLPGRFLPWPQRARCAGRFEERFQLGSPTENRQRLEKFAARYRELQADFEKGTLTLESEEEWYAMRQLEREAGTVAAFVETRAQQAEQLRRDIAYHLKMAKTATFVERMNHQRIAHRLMDELRTRERSTLDHLRTMQPQLIGLLILVVQVGAVAFGFTQATAMLTALTSTAQSLRNLLGLAMPLAGAWSGGPLGGLAGMIYSFANARGYA